MWNPALRVLHRCHLRCLVTRQFILWCPALTNLTIILVNYYKKQQLAHIWTCKPHSFAVELTPVSCLPVAPVIMKLFPQISRLFWETCRTKGQVEAAWLCSSVEDCEQQPAERRAAEVRLHSRKSSITFHTSQWNRAVASFPLSLLRTHPQPAPTCTAQQRVSTFAHTQSTIKHPLANIVTKMPKYSLNNNCHNYFPSY